MIEKCMRGSGSGFTGGGRASAGDETRQREARQHPLQLLAPFRVSNLCHVHLCVFISIWCVFISLSCNRKSVTSICVYFSEINTHPVRPMSLAIERRVSTRCNCSQGVQGLGFRVQDLGFRVSSPE